MKFSSTTATGTSAITVANVISKVAALAFIMASSFGVVNGNSYVSLFQKLNTFRIYARPRLYLLEL